MTDLVLHRSPSLAHSSRAIVLPEPRAGGTGGGDVAIRVARLDDLPFIDALQKKHSKMVGFLFLETLEKKIKAEQVLMAEEVPSSELKVPSESTTRNSVPGTRNSTPVGYCIFQDKYDKHDDCGIFYQVNVVPGSQRGLIGAALVKAALDRAAYGCKLACCWCAQDLQANHFWESLGFVPLAFRTGSRTAGSKKTPRIHIFWQRRIREGDEGVGATPYWYPCETSGGAVKENRLALPIPPGTHWSDAKPAVLPGMENFNVLPAVPKGERVKKERTGGAGGKKEKSAAPAKRPSCGMWFAPPAPPPLTPEEKKAAKKAAALKPKREKFKNDPKWVAAARELRDRYIEQINEGLLLPPSGNGKYDVSRQLAAMPVMAEPVGLLQAA